MTVDGIQAELGPLLRLVAAGALAAVLGTERERAHKAAGLRTHIAVGIAAALYMVLGELAGQDLAAAGAVRGDPIRAIQAVAMGIGFLGGGAIFVAEPEHRVHGLTTAASIWATAAIGIACGLGHVILGAGATVLLFVVLHLLARFDLG
jgi:putative Mg2+ transporter-C (MgtC) family protein